MRAAADHVGAQDGQALAVTVLKTQALPGEADLQNTVLLPQECDDVGLLTMEPATNAVISNWNGSMPAVYAIAVDPLVGHYGVIF